MTWLFQNAPVEALPEDVSNQINKSASRDVPPSTGSKVYRNYQQCIYNSMSMPTSEKTAPPTTSVREKVKEQHLKEKVRSPAQKTLIKL